ncbi:LCP family protein required for cell wall assembly [Kitasatospora gansuensis]|uniref:LCP family protein required for cell wall assembly n=1 Tax=Kitasatospora gansuensis TaxID=258050 RepID=A0A7W7WHP4_9ACTN|nr:LCP family protein [Kitasatospora gansuensis]MBB4946935.1 LCP family protein required for cell wall assembly [Kitasatospora gansuensis]
MAEHRRKTLSRRVRLRRTIACTVAGLLVIGGGAAGYAYWKLNGNIKSVDINAQLGTARPPASTNGSFNVLVLGSDSRNGKNGDLAGGETDGTARSDTAMVVHVNQAHTRADVVSIPRDTLVARPACSAVGTGKAVPAAKSVMFNTAYEVGGPACAVKTTEQLTGLRMDHYVEIDFAGFADLVNSIGGVTVTTTVAIDDKDSGLHLAAGTHQLNGDQALAFVRTRHGVGDGSDLGRIELQKQMVKSILTQIKGMGLTSNPAKLWSVADKLTKSVTTDSELASVSALAGLADTLKPIGPENLDMVTLPVVTAPSDPNRVIPAEPRAAELWQALAADRAVPESVLSSQPANPAEATPSAKAGSTRSGAAGATHR